MVSLKQQKELPAGDIKIPRRDVPGCLEWLNQTYQTAFQVWEWREQARWTPLPQTASSTRTDHEILIHQHVDKISPTVTFRAFPIASRLALIVIPIEPSHRSQIAIGIVPQVCLQYFPATLKLLLKQRHQSRLVVEQHRLLDHYASYASLGLEELSWFSSLVENISFSETDHKLTPDARTALDGLKNFIQAETLAFVLCDTTISGHAGIYKRIFSLGKTELDSELVLQLLKLAGPNFFCESYINNHIEKETHLSRFNDEIQSLVIIPALCNHRCFGWLIAINRQNYEPPPELGRTRDREHRSRNFNTKTALLMESAASVLATHAHNLQLLNEQQGLLIGTVRSLVNTIDAKDKYTCGHSDRVAQIAKCIAHGYGLSDQDCQKIYLAGLLHDIGKIGVRDEVLMKAGQLTPEEFAEIKMHPVFGYEILKHLHQLEHVLPGVMHHHESWDGKGYPHQLKEEEIPLAARILSVADAYDAMTSDRSYRKGMPPQKAEAILKDGAGKQWEPAVVEAFFRILPKARRIITQRSKRSYLPVNRAEYVFEEDLMPQEDLILSAIMTTTSLSDIAK